MPLFFFNMNPYEDPSGNYGLSGGNNPFEAFENSWLFHQYDNFANGGLLYQTLNPGESQYSEWSQQMTAQMYMNWYNSAPQQMERAKQAGINPFVAASGIMGAGNQSFASAPPTVQKGDILQDAASLVGSAGSAFGNFANGFTQLAKVRHEINKIDADTKKSFEDLGFTALQSRALSIELKYLDRKEQIGVFQALANLDKTKQEYQNLLQSHNNLIAEYQETIANKDLLIVSKGEVIARQEVEQAQKNLIAEQAKWAQTENEFFAAHHYKLGTPIYESIRDMVVQGEFASPVQFGDVIANYDGKVQGAIEDARQQAISNHAYAIEYARSNGKNASDELFGRIGSPADFAGRIAKMGTDFITNLGVSVSDLFKSGDAKSIRNDLNMILQNAYDQLEKYPEDEKRLTSIINECQAALSLRNSELVEWWKTKNR